jgi:hypothetical protein
MTSSDNALPLPPPVLRATASLRLSLTVAKEVEWYPVNHGGGLPSAKMAVIRIRMDGPSGVSRTWAIRTR